MRTFLFAALFPAAVFAQTEAPQWVISHNGRLWGSDDAPLSGTHELTFSIYANKTRPDFGTETASWTEKYDVQVFNGQYALALGETDGKLDAALTGDALGWGAPRWIEIAVDGTVLEPRLRIGSVPRAIFADRAGDLECDGCVQATDLAGNIPPSKLATSGGKVTGLDADLLDGYDASAFAVDADIAQVRTDIAAVKSGVDAANTALGGLGTDLAAVASDVDALQLAATGISTALGGLAGEHATLQTDVTAVKNQVAAVASSLGTGRTSGSATQDLADIKAAVTALGSTSDTAKRQVYSLDCTDFAQRGWSSRQECLQDGRWHKIGAWDAGAGKVTSAEVTLIRALANAGAEFKVQWHGTTYKALFPVWYVLPETCGDICMYTHKPVSGTLRTGAFRIHTGSDNGQYWIGNGSDGDLSSYVSGSSSGSGSGSAPYTLFVRQ